MINLLKFFDSPIGIVALLGVGVFAGLWMMYERGYANGEASALLKAQQATERAINELADEADRARVRRRLCIDGGGVWSFADNKCEQVETEPER